MKGLKVSVLLQLPWVFPQKKLFVLLNHQLGNVSNRNQSKLHVKPQKFFLAQNNFLQKQQKVKTWLIKNFNWNSDTVILAAEKGNLNVLLDSSKYLTTRVSPKRIHPLNGLSVCITFRINELLLIFNYKLYWYVKYLDVGYVFER